MHSRTVLGPCKLERRVGRAPRRKPAAPAPAMVTFAVSLSFGASSAAMAGPTGGTVVQGQGSISAPSSSQTVINQSSQQLTLNWNSFNVGANESVRFYQPSSSAIAFNRILGQSASQIFGQIDANGKVVLVNPNGVLIGRTAQLNVSSLVVSSLDAIDFNAASGRYRFSATRNDPGAVVNEGTITAQPGGSVTLLGGSVSNSGTIVADYGTVNLAAGRMATLDLAGDGLLRLEVGGDLGSNDAGVASAVENSGSVIASGGHVLLTASAVKNVFENLVNNTGVVRANRIDNSGGTIELLGPGGTVLSSGTLDASAGDAVSTGGTVSVLGNHVGLLGNAVVNVSGATGGGAALIGGDTHGANPAVLDATETYVSSGATLDANAGQTGDGGRIVVWSNDFTRYFGSLSARGGILGGNGGFAEVSGKQTLEFLGHADLTAAHGTWGTLLLDPDDITIDGSSDTPPGGFTGGDFTASGTTPINIGALTIETLLNTTNVQLTTTGSISNIAGPGGLDGTIDVSTTGNSGVSLSLSAGTGITLNYPILTHNGAISLTTGGGDITLQGSSSLNAGSALITMEADSGSIVSSNGGLVTAGSLHLTASGSIGTASKPLNTALGGSGSSQSIYAVANGGDVYIDPTSSVELTTAVATNTVNVTGSGDIAVDDVQGNSVTLVSTGGSIFSNGAGNTPVITTGGSVTLDAQEGIGVAPTSFTNLATGKAVVVEALGGVSALVDDPAGHINLTIANPTLPPPLAGGSIQLGTGVGTRTGSVVVQSTGGLSANAGSIVLGSGANTATVVLSAPSGTLTLDSSGNVTDHPADTLLLSAQDILASGGTPHTLGIAAGDLIFNATLPSGNVTLNTSVTQLDSTLGGTASLTVNQSAGPSGSLALGDISVGGGLSVSTSGTSPGIAVNGDVSVTGTASLNATGNIGIGASGTVAGSSVSLIAGQNITAVTGSEVNSGTITLQGQAIGTSVSAVNTESSGTAHLTTTSSGGGTYVRHSGVLNLTASDASGGAVNVSTTGAGSAMTVVSASGTGVALSTGGANSSLTTTGLVNGGSGGVSLTTSGTGSGISVSNGVSGTGAGTVSIAATGAGSDVSLNSSISAPAGVTITAGSASTSWNSITEGGAEQITSAGTLTMTAGAIGTGLAPLNTTVGKLDATAKAVNGGIFINQSGALEVVNASAAGAVSVTTGQGSASGGALTVDAASGNGVTLTAGGVGNGLSIAGAVNGGAGGATLTAGGAITASSGSSVSGNSIDLTGTAVGTNSAAVETASVGGGPAASLTASGAGGIYIQHTGNVSVSNLSGGSSAVSLIASGAITAGAGEQITTTNTFTVSGTSIGVSGTPLNTTVGALNATATNGGVFVNQTGALDLINATATGAVSLTSGGAITATPGSLVRGTSINLTGTAIGTSSAAVDTASVGGATTLLTATSTSPTVGGIYIQHTGDASLAADAASGAVNVGTSGALTVTAATGTSATLSSGVGQNLNVDGVIDVGAGTVALVAGGAITAGGSNLITASTLTGGGTSIGASGARLNTAVGLLNTGSTNGGTYIIQAGDVTVESTAVNGPVDVQTTNGSIDEIVTSGTGIRLAAGGAGKNITVNSALTGGAGDVTLVATGDGGNVVLNNPVSTTGNVTITAGSPTSGGVIAVNGGASISGDAVTVSALSIGAPGSPFVANATTLNATSTAGGIYVMPNGGLSLTANATGGPVDVETLGGPLTVASASGDGVTLATNGDGYALTTNGTVDGRAGGVTLTTNGVGSDIVVNGGVNGTAGVTFMASGAASNIDLSGAVTSATTVSMSSTGALVAGAGGSITGDAVTLLGAAVGSSGTPLNVAAHSLSATTLGGDLYVQQLGDLTLTAHATGGVLDVESTNGALDVLSASGSGVKLVSGGAAKDIDLNGAVDGGSGTVTLTAGGNIVAGAGEAVTGGSLTASGASIGAVGAPLVTAVGGLGATATTGGIFVNNTGALALSASAPNGALAVNNSGALTISSAVGTGVTLTTSNSGSDINVTGPVIGGTADIDLLTYGGGGNISLGGAVSTAANVTLMAGTAASPGAILTAAGNQVTANLLTATGSSIGAGGVALNTTVGSLNATSYNGNINVRETDGLDLNASATGGSLTVTTANGPLTVESANGTRIALTAGGAGGVITLNGSVTGGAGDVSLTSGSALVAGTGSQVIGNNLTISASQIGASSTKLNTAVNSLDASASSGGIFVAQTGSLALNAVATGGALDVETTNGTITVSAASGSEVTLAANGGAIVAGAGNSVRGSTVDLLGASIGATGAALNTTTSTLSATATNGGIFVNNTGALDLTANATSGSVDVGTSGALTVSAANGNGVTLTTSDVGAGITVNGAVNGGPGAITLAATGTGSGITLNNTLNASGAVTLTAGTPSGGGAIVGGAGSHINGASLTAMGSAIGTSASPLKTSVASLQTTSTNGGTYVDETDAVTLTASATGGALNVQTDNGALVVAGATGAGITLTAGGAGSGITLNGAVNAGAGDDTLTAGTATNRGAVLAGAGANVSGATLSVQAASIGSSAASLNTNIATLIASANTGDIDIVQQKALNLASVQAAGGLNITAAGGDITVGNVSAGNNATLTANSGAIADDGDKTTQLTANTATLQARSIGVPSTLVGTTIDSKLRLGTDVNDLVATSTAGGVYINQQQGLASATVHASGGKAGNIELLTAKGDLNIQSVTASGTVLLAAGANLYALPGSGPITAQAAELRAGGADANSGHIGTLSHPLVLELSPGATLRMFVPQTVNADDSASGPATLPSAGVESTLSLFAAPNGLAVDAGFGQFQGLGETQFTSQAELLVHSIQSQTAAVQTVLGLDWNSFNPNVSLFGKLDPSVCLPGDQRDEEEGASEASQKCVAK